MECFYHSILTVSPELFWTFPVDIPGRAAIGLTFGDSHMLAAVEIGLNFTPSAPYCNILKISYVGTLG
jgi:hypothetical protein